MHRVSLGAGNETNYPAPMNLTVTKHGVGGTWIQWDNPLSVSTFTYGYVYRNTENNFATATLLGKSWIGYVVDHSVMEGVQYWYWVRYGDGTDFGPTASAAWPKQTTGGPQPPANPPTVTGPQERVYEIAPASLRATQAPILATDDRVQIGAVREPALDDLDRQGEHDGIVLYSGRIQDGVTAETLRRYLTADALDSGYIAVLRFGEAPTVRIQKGATPAQIRETAHAVQLINYWLPADWKLDLDLRPTEHESGQPDDGVIVVEFSDRGTWGQPVGAQTIGWAHKWFSKYTVEVFSAKVWIDPGRTEGNNRIPALIHELLHALGRGHVDETSFPKTVMQPVLSAENGHVLYRLDQDALAAVYGVLGMTTLNADLAADLGPWTDASSYLAASLPDDDVQFGVVQRNGFARAWAAGPPPLFPLADNPLLSGSASWAGRLLGYTPDRESVGGRMDMTISLTTMTGDLDFTDMEKWGAGQTIKAVGTGSLWNTGALSYDVRVGGNYLLRTGGDDGELTGAFFGSSHEAVGGVLYRTDLAAGFGGSRSGLPRPPARPVVQTPVQCPGGTTVPAGQDCVVPQPEDQSFDDEQVRETLQSRLDSADVVLEARTFGSPRSLPSLPTHRLRDLQMGEDHTYEKSSIELALPLVQHVESHPTEAGHYDLRSYAGWQDHSFFHVWSRQSTRQGLTIENVLWAGAFSVGDSTGRNPVSGSARWEGSMLGADVSETTASRGRYVQGDASVEVNFTASSASVSFTNIADVATGAAEADISWRNMPMVEGSFSKGAARWYDDTDNYIHGTFYGPNHEEAGGVFQHHNIRGAFGAKRE